MYRVHFDANARQELIRRAHHPHIAPSTRDRLEMVRLSDAGWSIPKIAGHLSLHEQTVRRWIKVFLLAGFDALVDAPHLGKPSAITANMRTAVQEWITKGDRTWNARQIAEEVTRVYGVRRSQDRWQRLLRREKLGYKRTSRNLKHKQHPEQVAARKTALTVLEKRGVSGEIDLAHLDEAGFAMTLPTCYSWFPIGQVLRIPYEAPQGRRVNAIGAYVSHGPLAGRLLFETYARLPKSKAKKQRKSPEEIAAAHDLTVAEVGPIDSVRLVRFLWQVAGRPALYGTDWKRERPLYIVLDNYSVHTGQPVQKALAGLEVANVFLFYLPSYSPELSKIEPIWKAIKHYEMPVRSHSQVKDLKSAVEAALSKKAEALWAVQHESTKELRRAA